MVIQSIRKADDLIKPHYSLENIHHKELLNLHPRQVFSHKPL